MHGPLKASWDPGILPAVPNEELTLLKSIIFSFHWWGTKAQRGWVVFMKSHSWRRGSDWGVLTPLLLVLAARSWTLAWPVLWCHAGESAWGSGSKTGLGSVGPGSCLSEEQSAGWCLWAPAMRWAARLWVFDNRCLGLNISNIPSFSVLLSHCPLCTPSNCDH